MQEEVIATPTWFRPAAPVSIALAIALALTAAGCSKATKQTAPPCDDAGEHLLVFGTTRVSGSTSQYDIVLYDADAAGYRSLAGLNSTYGQGSPSITDDGGFIGFDSNRPTGAGGSDVYIYNRCSQALVPTPGLNTAAAETRPRFTHDSVRMTFVRDSAGLKRVRLYEPFGDTLIALPGLASAGAFDDDAPAPDLHGDRIAFQSNRSGAMHVYVWNRVGGLADPPGLVGDAEDAEPSLSANGRWLAFASTRSGGQGGWDVYLYDLLASAFVPLPRLNTGGDETHPAVSADGRLLFFAARTDPSPNRSLWRYTPADSNRVQPANLASTAGDDRQPYLRWR